MNNEVVELDLDIEQLEAIVAPTSVWAALGAFFTTGPRAVSALQSGMLG